MTTNITGERSCNRCRMTRDVQTGNDFLANYYQSLLNDRYRKRLSTTSHFIIYHCINNIVSFETILILIIRLLKQFPLEKLFIFSLITSWDNR